MLPAFGLYTHIQANRRRSVALLIGLFFLVYVIAYAGSLGLRAWGEAGDGTLVGYLRDAWRDLLWLAPAATVATLAWISLAYWLHQAVIDLVLGSRPLARDADEGLHDTLEALCISRGMRVPQLKILEVGAVNAFASGLDEKQYTITVTCGLLDSLDKAEIEAVLAHELTHIRNEDVRMMVVAGVIAGIIAFVGELVFRWMGDGPKLSWSSSGEKSSDKKGKGGGAFAAILIALALVALAWGLSQVIRFSLSRSREYLADAGAVELTKNPDAMISALLKIEGKGELPGAPSGIMEMCVDNPRSGYADLLATHPSIEERVEALVRHAGGRRPVPSEAETSGSAVAQPEAA